MAQPNEANASRETFIERLTRMFMNESAASDADEDYYRAHHAATMAGETSGSTSDTVASDTVAYDAARPAYQLGHTAARSTEYANRTFDDVETDLRAAWESQGKHAEPWDRVRSHARDAYDRGQEQRLTLSEEQLAIGKRQVQAGEVSLRKSVETEHVTTTIPLVHEEVTIERHALTGTAATDAEIGEQTIRVPLMAEEAVVEKKVVAVEEVVIRKSARTEQTTVEADVRKERLVTTGIDETGHSTTDGAVTGSHSAD